MKQIILFLFSFTLLTSVVATVVADNRTCAEAFLKGQINRVIETLKENGVSEETKRQRVSDIATTLFDFPLMAKLTLGKKHWPRLSGAERIRFTDLFIERLKSSYLDKMMRFNNEDITFFPAVAKGKKVFIPTTLTTDDQKISIRYKLYKKQNNWKLYDLEIQDVSLIQSYKDQFEDILKTGTPGDLFK